jgi:hypothetical protein
MTLPDPAVPFGVAWISMSLYREVAGPDPLVEDRTALGDVTTLLDELGGTRVEVDGWDEALDRAWAEIVGSSPAVRPWVSDYVAARGDQDLTVSFADTTRVLGRRGYGGFAVSCPADLLLDAVDDKVAAMHTAVLVVLDRHVDRQSLDVPLLSDVHAGA